MLLHLQPTCWDHLCSPAHRFMERFKSSRWRDKRVTETESDAVAGLQCQHEFSKHTLIQTDTINQSPAIKQTKRPTELVSSEGK